MCAEMAKQSDTESNSASNSSNRTATSRRRSERLRKKYGEDLERFSFSVSPSPGKRKRKSETVQKQVSGSKTNETSQEESETTHLSASQVLEPVPEEKNKQQTSAIGNPVSTDSIDDSSVPTLESGANIQSWNVKRNDPPYCDVFGQYEEFCRQLQPYIYTEYIIAAFQVAKDLYLVRKWCFVRVIPLVGLERYVIIGSPKTSPNQMLCLYSVIPVPVDSVLTPEL